ncbi:MAG TPA: BTAD domain-containing putative transcriptional regulator [Stackebrandtia sp.]|uniref:ATP-binding protein n=1 Tax=Stackebrandtia sp. TaxID=2023065 RepID=UPI002D49C1E2|nr:BTAD domain-containing putative transcriptional regulator [Stackebrandtia sp.]HZE40042.1 BTAD domain-containing putative transcriptional regulator [Stackebrandtia sp.]
MECELTLLPRVAYRGEEVAGQRLRALLALLADDLRAGCGAARLVEGLWPLDRPANPTKALQVLVSRARSQLGADLIARTASGYRLTVEAERVDASAIQRLSGEASRLARGGDHTAALSAAERGLELWDGAMDETATVDDPLVALRMDRLDAHQALRRVRALALARLGRYDEALESLADLVSQHPRDEELLAELLRCEAETAGRAAALSRYDAYRRGLRDDLGTDPGPALRELHQWLLRESTPVVRQGIAHEPNPLVGRDGDITAVLEALRTSRVTSIVGPGGLGKTRLVNAVARRAPHRVVQVVALAGVETDAAVTSEVVSALGASDAWPSPRHRLAATDALASIVQGLGSDPALLVLDNCEHVLGGAADLVGRLISMSANLQVLTTSRAPLGLSSETVYPLPELSTATAVDLFTQRVRAVRPDAELPADAVYQLCQHLDGLPLAVELAAARVRVMSVPDILSRLADRFALLRGGPRDAPRRHHTLSAVVDWSWNLLDADAQAAMRMLSIFVDGFTAGAAASMVDGDALDILENLADQSLLKVTETAAGTRFRMLETVREFAAAKRDAAGDTPDAVDALCAWARDLGHRANDSVFDIAAMRGLRVEQDNLARVLRIALDARDGRTLAATFAVVGGVWLTEAHYARVADLTPEVSWVLSHHRPEPDDVAVARTALTMCAVSSMMQGPRDLRCLVTLRRLPSPPTDTLVGAISHVLIALPEAMMDVDRLAALCEHPEPLVASIANVGASFYWQHAGDDERAMAAARRVRETLTEGSDPWLLYQAHARLGELSLLNEQGDEALIHIEAAMRLSSDTSAQSEVDSMNLAMVLAHLQRGDAEAADVWVRRVTEGMNDPADLHPFVYGTHAEVLLLRGDIDAGLRLWRLASDSWDASHTRGEQLFPADFRGLEPWTLETRSATVVSHARHHRLSSVDDLVADLPVKLQRALDAPNIYSAATVAELPVVGGVLLALGMADIERGRIDADASLTARGVDLVALADRLGFVRQFHPTMSSARARRDAEAANADAYRDAVSRYASSDHDKLRDLAAGALRRRRSAPQ